MKTKIGISDQPAASSSSVEGMIVDDTYEVAGLIGRGGAGVVYRAFHRGTGEAVAIKILDRALKDDDLVAARLRAEALIASALRHPHIVQIIDTADLPDGRPYIVMELLDGEDLHQRLCWDGAMELAQALFICRQAGLALHEAHKHGVVHRDIKPSNVFLTRPPSGDGPASQVKLIDFGVARMRGSLSRQYQTLEYQLLGTPAYMSPEALLGLQNVVDEKSDQYSLALVLCQMLIGKPNEPTTSNPEALLHSAGEAPQLFEHLPPWVPTVVRSSIRRALSWRKDDRFPSILDFVNAVCLALPSPASLPAPLTSVVASAEAELTGLAAKAPLVNSARSRPLILVVDDDPDLRDLLRAIFEMAGFACHLLGDASDALEVVRALLPQVVLLDIMLPGKSGYKLCWEIKSQADTRHIPVLLLSGKVLEADRKLGLAMKADAYIEKPFDTADLIARVHESLRLPPRRSVG